MTHKARPLVGIVMGSDSDMGVMRSKLKLLPRTALRRGLPNTLAPLSSGV